MAVDYQYQKYIVKSMTLQVVNNEGVQSDV